MAFVPAVRVEVSDLTMERSADVVTGTVAVAELFDGTGSLVVEVTLAVFVSVPVTFDATLYVEVIVAFVPDVIVPRLQGNGVVHAPEFDTNVSPAGGASVTLTPVASDGPEFNTVIV